MFIALPLLALPMVLCYPNLSRKHLWPLVSSLQFKQRISSAIITTLLTSYTIIQPYNLEVLAADEPTLKIFSKDENQDLRIGSAIYDDNDVKDKVASTQKAWDAMFAKVETAIKEGKKKEAKNAITLPLFQLKADMRQLSKVACKGDIYVRRKVGGEANFDYNSGQFEIQPLAQKPEQAIDILNDLYFYGIDKGLDCSLKELEDADKVFDEWVTIIKQSTVVINK